MQALIERYSADQDSLRRVYTDRLSPTTRQRMSDFQATWRQQLAEVKFEALDQEGNADYLLLKNHLDRVEHRSAVDEAQWKEVEPLLPFAAGIFSLEDARRRVEPANGEQIASQLNAMARPSRESARNLKPHLPHPKQRQTRARKRTRLQLSPGQTALPRGTPLKMQTACGDSFSSGLHSMTDTIPRLRGGRPSLTKKWIRESRTTRRFCARKWPALHRTTRARSSACR